jgi:small-conductance mechanosensitive channel
VLAQTPQTLTRTLQDTQTDTTAGSDTTQSMVSIPGDQIDQRVNSIKEQYRNLAERKEIRFSSQTFRKAVDDIQALFHGENRVLQDFKNILTSYFSTWNNILNLIVSILILFVCIALFFPLRKYLKGIREICGESEILAVNTGGYLLEITIRALPTLILTLAVWLMALILDLPAALFNTILKIAGAILGYKFGRWLLEVVLAPDEVRERLVNTETRIAKYFFHITRAFLQWTLLYAIILFILQYMQYLEGVVSFVKFVYRIGAVILFAVLFARRQFTMDLFPDASKKFFEKLHSLFSSLYYPFYGILVFSGILSILGYTILSGFIFSRVFYTAATIIIGTILRRILLDILDWVIPEDLLEKEREEEETSQLWNRLYSVSRILISAILAIIGGLLIAKVWWLLGEQSIPEAFISFFTFTLFVVQDTEVTIWSFIKGILIIVLFIYFSKSLRKILNAKVLKQTSMDRGARHAILTMTHYILLLVGIVVALESIGINLTTLKVFAGALGLGIGFGLQNIANNFASGLIILFERPIKTKDFVHVGDVLGTITKISARSTTILTRDNIAIIVPNSDFIEKTVINWSLNDTPTRLHVPIGVEYGTDVDKVEGILLELAEEHPRVLKYPKSRVWFREFADSSLNFELLVWINDPQEGVNNIRSDLNFQIAKAFEEHEIGIPFPQRDVHFKVDSSDVEIIRKLLKDE